MAKDYYGALGVSKTASKDEIKKAFRTLAHKYHPDKKDGNAEKFKEVNEAYSVLSDEQKRAQYDQFGSAGPGFNPGAGGFGGGGFNPNDFGFDFSGFNGAGGGVEFDLGDIFGDIFGGGQRGTPRQQRGSDLRVDLDITFEESIFGTEKNIYLSKTGQCNHCKGSGGEPGTTEHTCSTCSGKGKITESRRSMFGNFASTKTCPTCHGKGKTPKDKCKQCKGAGIEYRQEEVNVRIPAGIENGESLELSGKGEAIAGGPSGNLYVYITVRPHSHFKKEGNNLVSEIKVKLTTSLLGGEMEFKMLDGNITVTIPEGIRHGEVLRIKGKGVNDSRRGRGDLYLKVSIDSPKKLSKTAKKAIEELKAEGL